MRKLILALALITATAQAGEADIRKALQSSFPGSKVASVGKSALPGLYEVVLDGAQGPMVVYSDEKGHFILAGDLIDLKNERNLTRERMDALTAIPFDSLPFKNAIKIVKGNGKRKLAVFSDIDCPFCKKLESELAKVDNVTIYNFPYPLPMHGDAPRKSRLIWCSKDRAAAWTAFYETGKLPDNKGDCDTPVEENLVLGQKLRIDGTPALIFANGKRVPGYMPAARLDAMLDDAEKARK